MRSRQYFFIMFCCFFLISLQSISLFDPNINRLMLNEINYNSEYEILNTSPTSEKIHIFGNSGWLDFKNAGRCEGNGSYSDPYIIEDLIINVGIDRSCIIIEESSVYFKIENCTLFGSASDDPHDAHFVNTASAGIKLIDTINGRLVNNSCYLNDDGIYFYRSNNCTIIRNKIYYAAYGIYLRGDCDNNKVLENKILKNEIGSGIHIFGVNNLISMNEMTNCGLYVSSGLNNIENTNLVNGKPLYYYWNEENLGMDNFTNAGQIILKGCHHSLISNTIFSNVSSCITLYDCYYITISGNTLRGLYLNDCWNNFISNNLFNNGFYLKDCRNNSIRNNVFHTSSYGIDMSESSHNSISGNIVNSNSGRGISLNPTSPRNYIYENTINNNYVGIEINSDNNLVSANTLNYNYIGIKILRSYNKVVLNRLTGNGIGIALYFSTVGRMDWKFPSSNNIIMGNILDYNTIGIHLDHSKENFFYLNSIMGSVQNILEEPCDTEAQCKGNIFYLNNPIEIILISLVGISLAVFTGFLINRFKNYRK